MTGTSRPAPANCPIGFKEAPGPHSEDILGIGTDIEAYVNNQRIPLGELACKNCIYANECSNASEVTTRFLEVTGFEHPSKLTQAERFALWVPTLIEQAEKQGYRGDSVYPLLASYTGATVAERSLLASALHHDPTNTPTGIGAFRVVDSRGRELNYKLLEFGEDTALAVTDSALGALETEVATPIIECLGSAMRRPESSASLREGLRTGDLRQLNMKRLNDLGTGNTLQVGPKGGKTKLRGLGRVVGRQGEGSEYPRDLIVVHSIPAVKEGTSNLRAAVSEVERAIGSIDNDAFREAAANASSIVRLQRSR